MPPPRGPPATTPLAVMRAGGDRKSTRLNSSHANISYAVFCFEKKNKRDNSSDANILQYESGPSTGDLRSRTLHRNEDALAIGLSLRRLYGLCEPVHVL